MTLESFMKLPQDMVHEGGTWISVPTNGYSFVDTICCFRDNVVKFVGHTTRSVKDKKYILRNKPHRNQSIFFFQVKILEVTNELRHFLPNNLFGYSISVVKILSFLAANTVVSGENFLNLPGTWRIYFCSKRSLFCGYQELLHVIQSTWIHKPLSLVCTVWNAECCPSCLQCCQS